MDSKNTDLATLMVHFPLNTLYYAFLDPLKTPKKIRFSLGTFFTTTTFIYYYLVVLQFFELNGDRVLFFKTLGSFLSFTQGLLKIPPVVYYGKMIKTLILERKHFWLPTFSKAANEEINILYRYTLKMMIIFKYSITTTVALFYCQPLIKRGLFMTASIPPYKYAYEVLLVGEYIMGYFEVMGMVGFNCLYVAMCTDLIGQFRILKVTFITMEYNNTDKCFKEFKKCLYYHQFLLRYVNDIQTIFMKPLIVLYLITIASCCMEMLNIIEENANMAEKITSSIYIPTVLFQIGLFCIPASNLSQEILETADAIYLGAWEDATLELKKCIPLALARSQKVVTFKAAGIVDINNVSFLNVFKATFSFLTLIRNLNK